MDVENETPRFRFEVVTVLTASGNPVFRVLVRNMRSGRAFSMCQCLAETTARTLAAILNEDADLNGEELVQAWAKERDDALRR